MLYKTTMHLITQSKSATYNSTAPNYFTNTRSAFNFYLYRPALCAPVPTRREISKLPVGEEALLQMELGQLDNLISL